jgi:rhodanese-related sulfurtransferase
MIEQIKPVNVADWAARAAAAGHRPVVLDVREPWELQTASIQASGFELIHMPMASVPAHMTELDASVAIACLCHHGGRSQQVALFLAHQGRSPVANIAGGIHAWAIDVDTSIPRY